jgi:SAM-dependent methyltransferase
VCSRSQPAPEDSPSSTSRTPTALLLDSSPEALAITARRLGTGTGITFVEADIFEWDSHETFDTIVFSAWLHHVPHSRFATFWLKIQSLLTGGGRVIFDFPDASVEPPGGVDIPAEASDDYGFYAPVDGKRPRPLRPTVAGRPQPLGLRQPVPQTP